MATSDPTQILVQSNHWANEKLIEACRGLTDEQFRRTFEMGCGSLQNNLVHILGAMRGWGDLLAGRDQRDRLEEQSLDLDQISGLHEEISSELIQLATSYPAEEVLTAERGGRSYSFTRGGVVTHVTTHGMHHRAQCLNMLRQLGVDPLPQSSVVDWMLFADA